MSMHRHASRMAAGYGTAGFGRGAFVLAAFLTGAPPALADPPGPNWELSFADGFAGQDLDTHKWRYNYPWGDGHTHNHEAYVQEENVDFVDGVANLTAVREPVGGKPFTSGAFTTSATYRFTYGYAEARIRMPWRRGSWPAFWMLADGWPPEIDTVEYPLFTDESTVDTYSVNSFWGECCEPPSDFAWIDTDIDLGADFHTYALRWDSSSLRYYFDESLVKTASNQAQFQNMYILVDYAVGGWPGTPSFSEWPAGASDVVEVEWVRVWQPHSGITRTDWIHGGDGSWSTGANWTAGAPYHGGQTAWFGTVSATDVRVDWSNFRVCGEVAFDGSTNYTLGAEGDDLLQLAARSGLARLNVYETAGSGVHVIDADVDLYDDVEARVRTVAPLTINGSVGGGGGLRVAEGELVLSNEDNPYLGPTVIDGVLTLTTTDERVRSTIPDTESICVNQGGLLDARGLPRGLKLSTGQTLGGAGRIEGALLVWPGATLRSEGLALDGDLSLYDGTRLAFVVGPDGAAILLTGGVLAGVDAGVVSVSFINAGGFTPGSTYTLLDWSGAAASGVDAGDFAVEPGDPAAGFFGVNGDTLEFTLTSYSTTQSVDDGGWNDAIWGTPASPPTAGVDYVTAVLGGTNRVRASIAGDPDAGGSTMFAGHTLRIVTGTELLLLQQDRQRATADLRLEGGRIRSAPIGGGTGRSRLAGTLAVDADSELDVAADAPDLIVSSSLTGVSTLRLALEGGWMPDRSVLLSGDADAFQGRLLVADETRVEFQNDIRTPGGEIELEHSAVLSLRTELAVGRFVVDGYALPTGSYTGSELDDVVLPAAGVGNGANFEDLGGRVVVGGCVWSDLNGDGAVDAADATLLLTALRGPGVAATADVDGDGDADLADYAALQLAFGAVCD